MPEENFLADRFELFQELIGLGAQMELTIGVSLAQGESLTTPLQFDRALLATLAQNELQLNVLAFREEEGG